MRIHRRQSARLNGRHYYVVNGQVATGVRNLVNQPAGGSFPDEMVTFSELLSEAGYANRYVGRWHLGHTDSGGPERFGFNRWIPNDRYDEWRENRGLAEHSALSEQGWVGWTDDVDPSESRLGWAADRVIEQLDDLSGTEPFFLRWDTFEPHPPYVLPEPYASMYDPDEIEPWGSFADSGTGKPWIQTQKRHTWRIDDWSWSDWAPAVARYLGVISLLDDQLGRVLDRLDELGHRENTLVIYTADHGDMCGGHGMFDKHYVMYDDVVRVPLFAQWPDHIDSGRVCEDYVIHALDLAATFPDVAGADHPDEFQGESLTPLFDGEDGRDDVYATYYGSQMGLYTQRMIRDDDFKYVYNATAPDELYDLRADPHELDNLAADSEYSMELDAYQDRLAEWIRDTDDDIDNPWVMSQLRETEWVW
jgi:arylsulfatase A-like enzyme